MQLKSQYQMLGWLLLPVFADGDSLDGHHSLFLESSQNFVLTAVNEISLGDDTSDTVQCPVWADLYLVFS